MLGRQKFKRTSRPHAWLLPIRWDGLVGWFGLSVLWCETDQVHAINRNASKQALVVKHTVSRVESWLVVQLWRCFLRPYALFFFARGERGDGGGGLLSSGWGVVTALLMFLCLLSLFRFSVRYTAQTYMNEFVGTLACSYGILVKVAYYGVRRCFLFSTEHTKG